jgi:AraC-like DNA-binding protein
MERGQRTCMAIQLFSHRCEKHYRMPSGAGNAACIFRQKDCAAGEHEHSEAQVSLLFRGASPSVLTHSESGKTIRARVVPESSFFFPGGQPHRMNWNGDGELLNLYLSERSLQELADQNGCLLPSSNAYRSGHGVYGIGRFLLDEFVSVGGLSPTVTDHAISLIAHRVLRTAQYLPHRDPVSLLSLNRLQPAIDRIHSKPEEDFTLVELACLCNSSVFHFARSFFGRLGSAPFGLQRTLRLQKASELLLRTDFSIEIIGGKVGMENPTHFSRLFRRYFGGSPRAYRRQQPTPKS